MGLNAGCKGHLQKHFNVLGEDLSDRVNHNNKHPSLTEPSRDSGIRYIGSSVGPHKHRGAFINGLKKKKPESHEMALISLYPKEVT